MAATGVDVRVCVHVEPDRLRPLRATDPPRRGVGGGVPSPPGGSQLQAESLIVPIIPPTPSRPLSGIGAHGFRTSGRILIANHPGGPTLGSLVGAAKMSLGRFRGTPPRLDRPSRRVLFVGVGSLAGRTARSRIGSLMLRYGQVSIVVPATRGRGSATKTG
jgi:hypothetical protein